MKYLLLIYAKEGAWPPDEHREAIAESVELCHKLHAKRQYLDAAPLEPDAMSAHVWVREGQRFVSDGPFAETKEQLGGYFLVEADSLEEAIDIASQIPGSRRGTTEVRQLMELSGMPDRASEESLDRS